MIHLNLIEAAERLTIAETIAPVNVTNIVELKKKSRKKTLTAIVAALFAVVAFSCFLSVTGVPVQLQGLLPPAYLSLIGAEDPSRTALHMDAQGMRTSAGGSLKAYEQAQEALKREREATTIKQFVGEINPKALFNNTRTDYTSYLPLEKVSYQKASLGQFIAFLNTATPDDIGFSDCIFQAPNFYYVRGVAVKHTSQKSFLERIATVSSDFKTPPLPENAPATDITAFGKYNVNNVNLSQVSTFVTKADVSLEIKALKDLALANKVHLSGLDKPIIEDFGVYKRYLYKVTSQADFSELQAFIAAYAASPVRIGVRKVNMSHSKKELFTAMQLEMFVVK